jgi:hypothetical protein
MRRLFLASLLVVVCLSLPSCSRTTCPAMDTHSSGRAGNISKTKGPSKPQSGLWGGKNQPRPR